MVLIGIQMWQKTIKLEFQFKSQNILNLIRIDM